MSIELIGIIALGALVTILFLFLLLREKEIGKKFETYERVIEDLNRQNYKLNHSLKEIASKEISVDLNAIERKIEEKIKEEIESSLEPTMDTLNRIQQIVEDFQKEQISRIDRLENRAKEINFVPPSRNETNEKLVISQFKAGKEESQIAKDLRIGIGEVDFILKMANLK